MDRHRIVLALAVVVLCGATEAVAQQSSSHPDLQGFWTNGTLTPLQRPPEVAGRPQFTAAEAAEWERTAVDRARARIGDATAALLQIDVSEVWSEASKVDRLRTSLIVDPPTGLLPRPAPEVAARAPQPQTLSPDDPEQLPLYARCLISINGTGTTAVPPLIPPAGVTPYYQIVQTADYVVIISENIHDARVIRLNATHAPTAIRKWLGDSIGHWEGATLVVDTTNFRGDTRQFGTTDRLHLVERFTRTDAQTITYTVRVEDPDTWTSPWVAEVAFRATTAPMFESACHEGNWAVEGSLKGTRAEERRARKPEGP